MRHAAFSILPRTQCECIFGENEFDESSDSEMPYDSSDEEVWEEEEVNGDDG